jgi:alpha-L-arabinofuranosidase
MLPTAKRPYEAKTMTLSSRCFLGFCVALIGCWLTLTAQSSGNLLANPDFQSGDYAGWTLDPALERAGSISVQKEPGTRGMALRLSPSGKNSNKDKPFGLGQFLSAPPVAGKTITVQAAMKSQGAFGVVLVFAVDNKGKPLANVVFQQLDATDDFRLQRKTMEVPAKAANIIFGIVTPSTSGHVFFSDLYIGPGEPPAEALGSGAPATRPSAESRERSGAAATTRDTAAGASIDIDASRVRRTIPREVFGANIEWVRNANTIWDPGRGISRPEMVQRARDLGVTIIRYPGGGYADYYHWRDGIGPRNNRPTRGHVLDSGKSTLLFGTHELIDFCRSVGAEPMLQANVVTGTPKEAADWVAYCNRSDNPERAANGSSKPFAVKYWEIGNEQYIKPDGSLPLPADAYLPPAAYARKLKEYAAAMRAVDPSIKIGAVGGRNFGFYRLLNDENWNEVVLKEAAGQIDFLAVHNSYGPLMVANADKQPLEDVYRAMLAFPRQVEQNFKDLNSDIVRYAGPNASRIKIAVTEWGPLFAFDVNNRYVAHGKTLGSGLFVASLFQVFLRSERVDITTFFKLADESFMGLVNGPNAEPKAAYYAMELYTRHFGPKLVDTSVASPTFDSKQAGLVLESQGNPYLDAVSSLSADSRKLYLIVVNRHFESSIQTGIRIKGFMPADSAETWLLTAPSLDAHNGEDMRGQARQAVASRNPMYNSGRPGTVKLVQSRFRGAGPSFSFEFAPRSVTAIEFSKVE